MEYFKERTVPIFLLFLLLLITNTLVAQEPMLVYPALAPNDSTSVEEFIAQTLAGSGVKISNVERVCPEDAFGVFRAHPNNSPIANFDITEGVVLTTGCREFIPGPSVPDESCINNFAGDDNLDEIIPGFPTFDACVLEFDIVPLGDLLSFRYIFGSEEYTNYECDDFNDVFAFFLTGPNPAGGTFDSINIALIPGTTIPVSINNVNSGTTSGCANNYTEYYLNNEANQIPEVEYDGMTTTLTAFSSVIPCETYHLKLAIADAGDQALDSAVFLEAGSFSSPLPNLGVAGGYEVFKKDESGNLILDENGNPTPVYTDNNGNANGIVVEGCVGKTIEFEIENIEEPVTIGIEISGTATNGVDIMLVDGSPLPNELGFTPENPSVSFELIAAEDGSVEGLEYLVVSITDIGGISCFVNPDDYRDTIRIADNVLNFAGAVLPPFNNNYGPFCPNTPVNLQAYGAESYSWFPAEFLDDPTVFNPVATITEDVVFGVALVNGPCSDTLYLDEITLFEGTPPTVTPSYNICTSDSLILHAEGAGSYTWTPATNLTCTNCPNPTYLPDGENITYEVEMTYAGGGCYYGKETVTITYDYPSFLEGPEIINKCNNEEFPVLFTGGTAYTWEPDIDLSCADCPNPIIDTDVDRVYTVTAENAGGCENVQQIAVEVTEVFIDAGPDIIECTMVDDVEIGNVETKEGQTYQWSPVTGLSDPTIAKPRLTLESEFGEATEMVYKLTITDTELDCVVSDEILVSLVGHPTVDILEEEPTIYSGGVTTLNASGINNAGTYRWSPPESLSSAIGETVTARPDTTQLYRVEGTDEYGCKNIDSIQVNV